MDSNTQPVTALKIKLLRQKVGWSTTRLGYELGVSQSYISHLESENDPWPVRPKLALKFRALEKRIVLGLEWKRKVVLFSKYPLPDHLTILSRPRMCRGHRRMTVFNVRNQVYCSEECERLYKKRQKRKAHKWKKAT